MKYLIALLALTVSAVAQSGTPNFSTVRASTGTIGTLTLGTAGGVGLAAQITGTGTGNATITFNSGLVEFNTSGTNPVFDFEKQATFTGGFQVLAGSTIGSGVTVTNLGTIDGGNVYATHFSSGGSASRITLPTSVGTSGQVLALGTNGVTTSWVTPTAGGTGTASSLIAGGTIGNVPMITASAGTANTTITVSLAGNTTFDASGTVPGFAFSDSVALNAGASLAAGQTFTNAGTISGGTASGLTLASGTTTLAGVLTGGTLGNLNLTGTLTTSSGTFGPVFANGNIGTRDGSGAFMAVNTNTAFTQFATGYGSTAFSVPSGFQFRWANNATYYTSGSQDTTISRQGAGVVQFGTTAVGSAGSIALTNITAGGFIQISGALPAGNPSSGFFIGVGSTGLLQAKGTAGTITTLANP